MGNRDKDLQGGEYPPRELFEEDNNAVLSEDLPLCVDLDGTLLKTDTLIETAFILLKKNPLHIFSFIFWLMKGKANLKHQIASRVNLRVALLPLNVRLLSFLKKRYQMGQKIILATAANKKIANSIADYLGIFSEVLASDEKTNLRAGNKLDAIIQKTGNTGFIYAGNASEDLPIWRKATEIIAVNTRHSIIEKVEKYGKKKLVFSDSRENHIIFLKSIRIHQWAKNLLVFVPLITSHNFTDLNSLINSMVAFLSFCFCASSAYLLNDLIDLDDDRHHPNKKYRPLAAGELSLKTGMLAMPVLLCFSLLVSFLVNPILCVLLGFHFSLTFIYSFYLKKIPLVDVLTLALLYTLRIFFGAVAISVAVSQWLLSFSIFLFISLGFIKRTVELSQTIGDEIQAHSRGYLSSDLDLLNIFGIASGYISIIVFALYIDSDNVKILYRNPQMLWTICIFLFYWISRMWLKVKRGEMYDDPVFFAIKDKTSYIISILIIVAILFSK